MSSLAAIIQIVREYDTVETVHEEGATQIEINRTALLSLEEAEDVATGDRSLVSIVASRPNRTS